MDLEVTVVARICASDHGRLLQAEQSARVRNEDEAEACFTCGDQLPVLVSGSSTFERCALSKAAA